MTGIAVGGGTGADEGSMREMVWYAPRGDGEKWMRLRSGTSTKAVRRRCERRLTGLELPGTGDLQALVGHIADRLGHPIELAPVVLDTREVSGRCELRNGTYRITYQRDTSSWHQVHIVCHELGHLVSGHACMDVGDEGDSEPLPTTRVLSDSVVTRMLGRSHYDTTAEREAEVTGTLIEQHLATHAASPDGAVTWVAPALEHTWGGRV